MKTIFAKLTEAFSNSKKRYELLCYNENKNVYCNIGGDEVPIEAIETFNELEELMHILEENVSDSTLSENKKEQLLSLLNFFKNYFD